MFHWQQVSACALLFWQKKILCEHYWSFSPGGCSAGNFVQPLERIHALISFYYFSQNVFDFPLPVVQLSAILDFLSILCQENRWKWIEEGSLRLGWYSTNQWPSSFNYLFKGNFSPGYHLTGPGILNIVNTNPNPIHNWHLNVHLMVFKLVCIHFSSSLSCSEGRLFVLAAVTVVDLFAPWMTLWAHVIYSCSYE